MTYQEAISILRQHNIWRRYDGPIADTPEMVDPKTLGEAIDVVCEHFATLANELADAADYANKAIEESNKAISKILKIIY